MSASTMRALLFGATRGVGLALARRLHERGVLVTALVRAGSDASALQALGVQLVRGDAMRPDDVARAFDAHGDGGLVVSTLGGPPGTSERIDGAGNIGVIDAAVPRRPSRFVLVTSLGCAEMRPYMSARALELFGDALLAKTRAEEHLRTTPLAWTIIRPGGLLDGPPTGRGALYDQLDIHGSIHREDVAALIVESAGDERTVHRALVALDAELIRSADPPNPVPFGLSPASPAHH